jgi:hypothetical protein
LFSYFVFFSIRTHFVTALWAKLACKYKAIGLVLILLKLRMRQL